MSIHNKAIDSMFNDMDDFESNKMFGKKDPNSTDMGGVTITITPNTPDAPAEAAEPADEMCEGGEVKMADGGMVPPVAPEPEDEDTSLPPFLRKKKRI